MSQNWYKNYKTAKIVEEEYKSFNHIVVDSVSIGGYELVLAKNEDPKDLSGMAIPGTDYQLALQQENYSATNLDSHDVKTIKDMPKNPTEVYDAMKSKIQEWVGKYGVIGVGSMNPRKVDQYEKLIRRLGLSYTRDDDFILIGVK